MSPFLIIYVDHIADHVCLQIMEELVPGPGATARFKTRDNLFWSFLNHGPFSECFREQDGPGCRLTHIPQTLRSTLRSPSCMFILTACLFLDVSYFWHPTGLQPRRLPPLPSVSLLHRYVDPSIQRPSSLPIYPGFGYIRTTTCCHARRLNCVLASTEPVLQCRSQPRHRHLHAHQLAIGRLRASGDLQSFPRLSYLRQVSHAGSSSPIVRRPPSWTELFAPEEARTIFLDCLRRLVLSLAHCFMSPSSHEFG